MNIEDFFKDDPYSDGICKETRNRIKVSLAAYSYEVLSQPIMTDADYDALAKSINLDIDTRRPDLDKWFRRNFEPYTGSWIHGHPEKTRLHQLLRNVYNVQ